MKKIFLLMIALASVLFSNMAFADDPVIALSPNGTNAIKMSVGNTAGDVSWIWMDLGAGIDMTEHPVVTVQYDIYRNNYGSTPGKTLQNLFWHWVDADDNGIRNTSTTPDTYGTTWGAAWDMNKQVYPFGWYDYSSYHANMVLDDFATITLQFDNTNKTSSAWYDGSAILLNTPWPNNESLDFLLRGYDITLHHGSATGSGTDTVWIDNFKIMGSDIYSADFNDFKLGALDGQDGWITGSRTTPIVPEPSTMLLLGFGLMGLACLRGKMHK